MPAPRVPVSPALLNRWFTTTQATHHGVTSRQLWSANYRAVMPGVWEVRSHAGSLPGTGTRDGLMARLPTVMSVRPDAVASHVTAAILLGFRLPFRPREDQIIHLSVSSSANPLRVRGIAGHLFRAGPGEVWTGGGVSVTSPERTLVDLAAMKTARRRNVFTDDELVAVVDGIINEHQTGFHKGTLAQRSKPALADPVHRISLQIEGAHHDQRGQRVRDIERRRATEAADWIEIRVVAADLVTGSNDPPGAPPRLVRLVREARARVLS